MEKETSPIDKLNSWIKNSITLKLITITILMLLLLIPSSMIEAIINERENLNNEAIAEVSAKWANAQEFHGPILSIPLYYELESDESTTTVTRYWHILPEDLKINGQIEPKRLRRGIYEIVVYRSELEISGSFTIEQQVQDENLVKVDYARAFMTLGIADLRGIEDQLGIVWNEANLQAEPGSRISNIIHSGVTINIPEAESLLDKSAGFAIKLKVRGSQLMSFTPVGSTTDISLISSWDTPSFTGNFLPDSREVSKDGFKAAWKILQLNRNYPQQWIGNQNISEMNNSSFGVNLLMPLDDYQKSMRSAKYAVMTIALTFLIFFLVEILNKRKIHPFQYALVGLGLILFYILLVSISEHSNFNFAYAISVVAIEAMITLYSLSVFKSFKLSMLLLGVLTGIYVFLFVTLQLADYALLLGSVGLTVILGLTMYFTRNVNWYGFNEAIRKS